MKEKEILGILSKVGAVITDSHIVYTSGRHGSAYVNKDKVYPHTRVTSDLCWEIAKRFVDDDVDVVIAPAVGGVILSQWIAFHLSDITGRDVFSAYAEKAERSLRKADEEVTINFGDGVLTLLKGEELVVKEDAFAIKRGYGDLVSIKRVLVVEDVLTTGGSAKKVVQATRACGGKVIGVGVLCNRGGVTSQDLEDVPKLFALTDIKLDSWDEAKCPLCAKGAPINVSVGKGKEFLERRNAAKT
ncbi:MAG: phosphoribosyltransferase family protein [Candidatus Jorgensenbacteria bacterium]|nr:phosphoribosyltransferase family protein [Candidatus Jorgensenbacteria bacterium]